MPIITGPTAATSSATANTIVVRDAAARAQVADPSTTQDIATKSYVDTHVGSAFSNAATSQSALAGFYYFANATSGNVTLTLPDAPSNGDRVRVIRTDNSANFVFVQTGAIGSITDSGGNGLSIYTLRYLQYVELTYSSGTARWLQTTFAVGGVDGNGMSAFTASPTAYSAMARDSNGRSQVADPSAVQDVVTRNHLDVKYNPTPAWSGVATNRANLYDPRKGVYNWKGSNTRNLRRGLAFAARGGRTDWAFVGDSATAGTVSVIGTTVFDRYNAWPYAMRNALAGMGVPVGGTGLARVVDSASYADQQRYSTTGVWTNNASSMSTTAVGATTTFTPDVGGTMLDVWYYAYTGGGTFTVSVSGAVSGSGFTTVNTGATNVGWTRVRLTGLNMLANASKAVLNVTVAGSGVYIKGMGTSTPNGGLVCHNLAQSGSTAGPAATAGTWVDLSTQGIGVVMRDAPGTSRTITDAVFNGTTTMTSATAAFTSKDVGEPVDQWSTPASGIVIPENTYIASVTNGTTVVLNQAAYVTASAQTVTIGRTPSVVVIELGFNDMSNGRTAAAITADIQTIRGWWPNADCVLTVAQEGAYTLTNQSQANQDTLAAAMYQLADTLDVPLFDWRDRLGRYATGLANGVYGDTVHLVPSAQAMIGSLMAEIVGESAGNSQTFTMPTRDYDLAPKLYVDRNHRGKYAERLYARTNWR